MLFCQNTEQKRQDIRRQRGRESMEECSKSLSDWTILWRKERGIFMCCRWAEQRGKKRGEKIDRWRRKTDRMREWLREFEGSVKGSDCNGEKGTHGVKMEQKWIKMKQNGNSGEGGALMEKMWKNGKKMERGGISGGKYCFWMLFWLQSNEPFIKVYFY